MRDNAEHYICPGCKSETLQEKIPKRPDFTAEAKQGQGTVTGIPIPKEYQTNGSPYFTPDNLKFANQRPTDIQWQDEIPQTQQEPVSPQETQIKDADHKTLSFPDGKEIK